MTHKTRHERPGSPVPLVELTGAHLWEVTITASDGQIAKGVVAADDERKARRDFMFVQTSLLLRGQHVTYQVRQMDVP